MKVMKEMKAMKAVEVKGKVTKPSKKAPLKERTFKEAVKAAAVDKKAVAVDKKAAAVDKKAAVVDKKTEQQLQVTKKHLAKAKEMKQKVMKQRKAVPKEEPEDPGLVLLKELAVEQTPLKKVAEAPKIVKSPAPEKPKRPAGGAYGVYLQEQRSEIVKSLPAGDQKKITEVAKKAGALWKALPEDERKAFEKKFGEKTESYNAAIEDWKKAMALGGHPLETPSKKRKSEFVTPTKLYRPVKVSAESVGPLDPEALHEASGLGYEQAFRSLASCAVLIEKKVPHDKIVRALRASGGVEKKAFAACN